VALARSVMAKTRMASAWGPLVMKFLLPVRTYSDPLRTATVRISAASEPLIGSVRAKAPIFSPRANGARNSRFWSSVPNLERGSQ